MSQRIVFRCDASVRVGSGHVMRCLTLANALRDNGVQTVFICREHPGHLFDLIQASGHHLLPLPCPAIQNAVGRLAHAAWLGASQDEDADQVFAALAPLGEIDWLVVDHYALDYEWESRMHPRVRDILVIDDLADRQHVGRVLLDQNLGRKSSDYAALVPDDCTLLIGPEYALLRPEFAACRGASLTRRHGAELRHLMVFMGGADPQNATAAVLASLQTCDLPQGACVSVVMGAQAPTLAQVRDIAVTMPWATEVLVDRRDMAGLMSQCDLAIGAAGSTAWERCCLGLPTLLVALAENQRACASSLVHAGAALLLGDSKSIGARLPEKLHEILNPDRLRTMQQKCAAICDGRGTERVVAAMASVPPGRWRVRTADMSDSALLLEWANDPLTRKNAFNPKPIDPLEHHMWLETRLANSEGCRLFIVEDAGGRAVGQVRFELAAEGEWEISYALAPQFRGKRLGKRLLACALDEFRQTRPDVLVVGKVKLENTRSLRVFQSLDFCVTWDDDTGFATCRLPWVGEEK